MLNNARKLFFTGALAALVCASGVAQAAWTDWFSLKRHKEVVPMNDSTYNEECGACHFPYQPGLLPAASWRKLMAKDALTDHFGDNAELDEATRTRLLHLMVEGAADNAFSKRSKKIMASLGSDKAPLRIIEIPYIKDRHHEIPEKLIKGNPKVKSLSQCSRCHQRADKGIFDDDTVYIPNHGYWTW